MMIKQFETIATSLAIEIVFFSKPTLSTPNLFHFEGELYQEIANFLGVGSYDRDLNQLDLYLLDETPRLICAVVALCLNTHTKVTENEIQALISARLNQMVEDFNESKLAEENGDEID
ncbi:hypothetical protein [Vibrio sp. PNB22_8_1]|uniref:hypothetical protein n=1 Tax=unclassified Vibrio TaxID=2614977 RepID=UPI00406A57BF